MSWQPPDSPDPRWPPPGPPQQGVPPEAPEAGAGMPFPTQGGVAPYPSGPPATNGLAITALVTGIIAILLSWVPFINIFAVVLAIVAIITGVMGLRRTARPGVPGKGMSVAGVVTGGLALIFSVIFFFAFVALFSDPAFIEELQDEIQIRLDEP